MRRRSVFFSTILLVVAALVAAPVIHGTVENLRHRYQHGWWMHSYLGLEGNYSYGDDFAIASIIGPNVIRHAGWGGTKSPDRNTIYVNSVDPEQGGGPWCELLDADSQPFEYETNPSGWGKFWFVGNQDQTWMVNGDGRALRIDGMRCVESVPPCSESTPQYLNRIFSGLRCQAFLIDGKLSTLVETKDGNLELYELTDCQWKSEGQIRLLQSPRLTFGISDPFASGNDWRQVATASVLAGQPGTVKFEILPIDSVRHLFWGIEGLLLYRCGMELIDPNKTEVSDNPHSGFNDVCASATNPTNLNHTTDGWTVISPEMKGGTKWFPVAIAGEPAVLMVDQSQEGSPKVKVLRHTDDSWTEWKQFEPPFPSMHVTAHTSGDGQLSYMIVQGLWSRTRFYAIEPTGFRETNFKQTPWRGMSGFLMLRDTVVWGLLSGLALGTVAEFLMRKDSKEYQFRHQTVILATIWERGCARLIDLSFVAIIVLAVFTGLTFALDVDWITAAEIRVAGNAEMKANHPLLWNAFKIVVTCEVTVAITLLALILMQASWGLTPGKWICRLRTIRTTLTQCGIARSLVRELLLCVDSLNLFQWIPGILSIAFTNHRQRLGDLVADTIVIRARRAGDAVTASGQERRL